MYNSTVMLTPEEQSQRYTIFQFFIRNGRAPDAVELEDLLGVEREALFRIVDRLSEEHALVLKAGSLDIWMMHPFSGVPTGYTVQTAHQSYWANCGWDVLGVPIVVGEDASIQLDWGDGSKGMQIRIETGELVEGDGVVHFAVPAKRFWDDVGYT